MEKIHNQKQRAVEAFVILDEFIGDLVVGTRTIELYASSELSSVMTTDYMVATTRLCVFHIIITLAKWIEFYDKYNSIIPKDVRNECLDLRKELLRRGVRDFRNKVVGHIWDNSNNRPLTLQEALSYLNKIYDNNYKGFLLWVNNPEENTYPETVVGITEHVRKRIQQDFNISEAEVFGES